MVEKAELDYTEVQECDTTWDAKKTTAGTKTVYLKVIRWDKLNTIKFQ